MEQRTGETLRGLAVTTIRSIRQNVAALSGGQRQSVAVAKAVMWNSKLVILDEPTAALGVAQTRRCSTSSSGSADAGPRGRADLAQPARRLRGRRPDHRAAARPERRRVPRRGRRTSSRSSRRSPPALAGRTARRCGMSDTPPQPPPASPRPKRERRARRCAAAGGRRSAQATSATCRSSSALIAIAVFFHVKNDHFDDPGNFVNLIVQMAGITTIAHRRRLRAAARRDRPLRRRSSAASAA